MWRTVKKMLQQKKIGIVQKNIDLLSKNHNFVFIRLITPTHQALETLRKELKKSQSKFSVTKNTLFEKTINKLSTTNNLYSSIKKSFFPLKDPSALLVLSVDWSQGLSAFYQFIKKEKTLSFKFGVLDGKTYKDSELLIIAQLPPKDQLIANIIGSFKSPSSRLVYSMKFNLNKLVYLLKNKSN